MFFYFLVYQLTGFYMRATLTLNGLTTNRILTHEINLFGCPCNLIQARPLFFKSKVMTFVKLIHRFTVNRS